ncbi:MAG: ribonuclease P protein component [Candidatus Nanopelagicales bacterium]
MLPKHRRVRRSEDFRSVLSLGSRSARRCLVVHVCATGTGPARAGLIVGRPVGNAVVRNRVSRRLRHVLANVLDDVAPGTAIVVRALPPAGDATSQELAAELSWALRRALDKVVQVARTSEAVSP